MVVDPLLLYLAAVASLSAARLARSTTAEIPEYCLRETFNATCGPEEVILMHTARYGRMRFGRCVKEDHGAIGCAADVLSVMDRKCSGLQRCMMSVMDAAMHNMHPCPKELFAYLEASYSCVKVEVGRPHSCVTSGGLRLRNDHGYLASTTVNSSQRIGTEACPWILDVRPGQRINLTLYSFVPDDGNMDKERNRVSGLNDCHTALVIRENRQSNVIPVCQSHDRYRSVYVSSADALQIYVSHPAKGIHARFILEYTAVGCPDITGIPYGWVRRKADTAFVRCNSTGETYFLSCSGSQWRGELGNCTKASVFGASRKQDESAARFPYAGLLIVIGIGVALGVALGILMLFGILFCLRRRKEETLRSQTTDPLLSEGQHESEDTQSSTYEKAHRCQHGLATLARHPSDPQYRVAGGRVYTDTPMGGGIHTVHHCVSDTTLPRSLPFGVVEELPMEGVVRHNGTAGSRDSIDIEKLNNAVNRAAVLDRQLANDIQSRSQASGKVPEMQTSFITFKPNVIPSTPMLDTYGSRKAVRERRASLDLLRDSQHGDYRQLDPETLVLECTCTLRQGAHAHGSPDGEPCCQTDEGKATVDRTV